MTTHRADSGRMVLNVGGGNKQIPIPDRFNGWVHHLLDIDPAGSPDIVCDARELTTQEAGRYDAVYCSHNLEHYYPHDVPKVLRGFHHVTKPDGFVEIRVPDLLSVMEAVVANKLDLDDPLYQSAAGPIMTSDVVYGWHKEIERSGNDFYAHKTGFSPKTLLALLGRAGFAHAVMMRGRFELWAYGFKQETTPERMVELKLPVTGKK